MGKPRPIWWSVWPEVLLTQFAPGFGKSGVKAQVGGYIFTATAWLWGHQAMGPTGPPVIQRPILPCLIECQYKAGINAWDGEPLFLQVGAHFPSMLLLWTNCPPPIVLNINIIQPSNLSLNPENPLNCWILKQKETSGVIWPTSGDGWTRWIGS